MTIDDLKIKLKASLKDWKPRMAQAGVNSTYAFIASAALLPIMQAFQQNDRVAAYSTVGSLVAGVSGNLLANQIQKWKDDRNPAQQIEKAIAEDADLRLALDEALQKLDALSLARDSLSEADRGWFVTTLRDEIAKHGEMKRAQAWVTGNYNIIVQGDNANVSLTVQHFTPEEIARRRDQARTRYLNSLRRFCSLLPLAFISADESADEDVTLDDVYIELNTTTEKPLSDEEKAELKKERSRIPEDAKRPITAIEAATQAERLVLLGDPGSGKSAFVYRWLARLADSRLSKSESPAWSSADTLPILLALRDLVVPFEKIRSDNLPDDRCREALVTAARDQMIQDLDSRFHAPDFADDLVTALDSGDCLLVLDGLDEVPQHLRGLAKQTVLALIGTYHLRRLIVTCRIRSYVGEARLEHFDHYTLAAFNQDQIKNFANAWYLTQSKLNRLTQEQAQEKADDLASAAVGEDLFELASNPMLLTTLASIHQRETTLPRERVKLYDAAVKNLLFRWQKHKTGMSGAMAKFVDSNEVRDAMELLAYHAHSAGHGEKDAADLPRGNAIDLLETILKDLSVVNEFLQYVDHRAGLLIGTGNKLNRPERYRFPHRTFQEYLAGCYIARQPHPHRRCYAHAAEGDDWSLAIQLGAEELHFARRMTPNALELAYRLSDHEPNTTQSRRAILWSANIAARIGRDKIDEDKEESETYLKRLLPCLTGLMSSDLTPLERAEAGRALAKLATPDELTRLTPHAATIEKMELCFVPLGVFIMGSKDDPEASGDEQPQHEVTLPSYFISRYPITNAQFDVFVQAGGYKEERWWAEAIAAGFWKEGTFKGRWDNEPRSQQENFGEPFNLSNHPVVGVSWYESLAFTRWLTAHLHHRKTLSPDWEVKLPSEAEWEKAARGGVEIITQQHLITLDQKIAPPKTSLMGNSNATRRYPWGDDFDANKANTEPSGIKTTSAIGCFINGESIYGVQEMSGNVWEWCLSKNKEYPYKNDDGRNVIDKSDDYRVLRGGAFNDEEAFARCACRYWFNPHFGGWNLGFRLVASPVF